MSAHSTVAVLLAGLFKAAGTQATEALLLDAVEIKGHYDNAVGTADAASEGRVNASLINNRPTLRTGEIMEFIPGMIVTQHSGSGKANQFYLRG
ncbi:MAG TPA: TonB-dependent receptor, partial [Methylophilus sp.]